MSKNPLAAKIATPYARALYDFSVENNLMHQITADFQNLEVFFRRSFWINRIPEYSFNWEISKTRSIRENIKISIK